MNENVEGLKQLANKLIDKEVVFGDDLEMIFGKRPWVKEEVGFTKRNQQTTDNGQQTDSNVEENDNVSEETTKEDNNSDNNN